MTVDVVLVSRERTPRVLLIRRKHPPFAGKWALPGGFVEIEEDLDAAARRELEEETGIRVGRLEQLATFGAPNRDPRGRTISVVYLAHLDPRRVRPRPNDDAAEVAWFPLRKPPPLAFDHAEILKTARQRLRKR
ncbi:MAG: NUDIX hydrolase [Gemmataceae bacterium]|nr:NUDIX hydrolase [Gemmataceae bacterium]